MGTHNFQIFNRVQKQWGTKNIAEKNKNSGITTGACQKRNTDPTLVSNVTFGWDFMIKKEMTLLQEEKGAQ